MYKFFLIILLFYSFSHIECYVNSINNQDLSKCKTEYSKSESPPYKIFNKITNVHRRNNSLLFDFHFSVMAARDAHILLSPSALVTTYDPVYEIVLGAGQNTYSDIRRLQKSATKASTKTFDLLSPFDARSFWIHISKDGLIEVGKEGQPLAFLSWKDSNPLPIDTFSFGTWGGVQAKWFYDCPTENNTFTTSITSKETEKVLTTREKLKNYLFKHYDPYIRPVLHFEDLTIIHFGIKFNRIHLDEAKSVLFIDGIIQMEWLDEKINWNTNEFDNIEKLQLNFREIWQPDLILYNSASGSGLDFTQTKYLTINSEGWSTWVSRIHVQTWCDASGLGKWPKDSHNCDMQLGFWTQQKNLMLHANFNKSFMQTYSSEWQILNIESGIYLIPMPWSTDDQDQEYDGTFIIKFTIKRQSSFYKVVYFTPVFVSSVTILISFWLKLKGPYRIALYCFQLILCALFLTKLAIEIPAHPSNVPNLVHLYSYGLISTLVALACTILEKNIISNKHSTSNVLTSYFIEKITKSKWIKRILFIQNSHFSDSYNKLLLNDSHFQHERINVEESRILLTIAIDRFLFIIYLVYIIITLSCYY